jgi:flagellar secretion chaperone FliS
MPILDEYLETKVLTATPHQLHLMVIDGAIRHATNAAGALESDDFAQADAQLSRANQFVAELIAGLDASRQPEVVDRLRSVFVFVQQTLAAAERRHEKQKVADALRILRIHRETWIALGDKLLQEAIGSQPEPAAGYSWTL